MKRIHSLFLATIMLIMLAACNDPSFASIPHSDGTTESSESKDAYIPDDVVDYAQFIVLPNSGGTYDYYSYGYHWSTVTVSNFTYTISEQSKSEIRIDFIFTCTFDYLGERTAGSSFNFFINAYNQAGEKVSETIVNETHLAVGETGTTKHTMLIKKEIVANGISLKFEGNS